MILIKFYNAAFTLLKIVHIIIILYSTACPSFILAGADKKFRCGRGKNRGAEKYSAPSPPVFFCPIPPAEIYSAPGAEQMQGGGAENQIWV